MTINKEQAVSDAAIEAGFNAAGSRRYWLDEDSLSAIYLAMKAASHPLEQQQAVSGDVVERVARAICAATNGPLEGGSWALLGDKSKERIRKEARAAIEAYRTALQEEGVERRD